MALKVHLVNIADDSTLEVFKDITSGNSVLGVKTCAQEHGQFNSEVSTDNETITVISARGLGAFQLTDILLVTDKVTGGTFSLTITDGTYTETILSGVFNDAPLHIAHGVIGRIESWQGTRLDLAVASTAGNHTVTCTVGYIRVPANTARAYDAWNSER
jgi:hypothetical protein